MEENLTICRTAGASPMPPPSPGFSPWSHEPMEMEKGWQDFLAGKENGEHNPTIQCDTEGWEGSAWNAEVISQSNFWLKFREDSSSTSTVCAFCIAGEDSTCWWNSRGIPWLSFLSWKMVISQKCPHKHFQAATSLSAQPHFKGGGRHSWCNEIFFYQLCTWTRSILLCSFGRGVTVVLQEPRAASCCIYSIFTSSGECWHKAALWCDRRGEGFLSCFFFCQVFLLNDLVIQDLKFGITLRAAFVFPLLHGEGDSNSIGNLF